MRQPAVVSVEVDVDEIGARSARQIAQAGWDAVLGLEAPVVGVRYPDGRAVDVDLADDQAEPVEKPLPPDLQLSAARRALDSAQRSLDAAVRQAVADMVGTAYPAAATLVARGEYAEDGRLHLRTEAILDRDGQVLADYDDHHGDAFDHLTEEVDALLDELAEQDETYRGRHEFPVRACPVVASMS